MQERPLIVQVIPTLHLGGAERFVIELTDQLNQKGFRVKLFSLFDRGPLWDEVRGRDIPWVQLLSSHEESRFTLLDSLARRIFTEGDRSPTLIHTHLFGSDFWVALTMLYATMQGKKFRERPWLFSTLHNIDHEDGVARRIARRFAMKFYDRVIPVSEGVSTYAIQNLHVPKERIHTIDGMNTFVDFFLKKPQLSSIPQLLTIGRLVEQKGIDTALRALAQIPPPWEYTIVGDGPLRHSLEQLAEQLGIASRVVFVGAQKNVRPYLTKADIVLMPSRWEGLGMVGLEASSCGIPVLASDIPSLRSFLPREHCIPVDQVTAWTEKIQHALQQPKEYFDRAESVVSIVRSRFHPETVTQQYIKLYEKFLNTSRVKHSSR